MVSKLFKSRYILGVFQTTCLSWFKFLKRRYDMFPNFQEVRIIKIVFSKGNKNIIILRLLHLFPNLTGVLEEKSHRVFLSEGSKQSSLVCQRKPITYETTRHHDTELHVTSLLIVVLFLWIVQYFSSIVVCVCLRLLILYSYIFGDAVEIVVNKQFYTIMGWNV